MEPSKRFEDFGCKTFEMPDGSKLLKDEHGSYRIQTWTSGIATDVYPYEQFDNVVNALENAIDEREQLKKEKEGAMALLQEVHSLLTWKFPSMYTVGVETRLDYLKGQLESRDKAAQMITDWVVSSNEALIKEEKQEQ